MKTSRGCIDVYQRLVGRIVVLELHLCDSVCVRLDDVEGVNDVVSCRSFRTHSESEEVEVAVDIECLPLAIVIKTTANGRHYMFSGRHIR